MKTSDNLPAPQPHRKEQGHTPLTDGILATLGPGDGSARMYERNVWLKHARTLEGLLYQARENAMPAMTEDLAVAIRQCQIGLQQSDANPVQVLTLFANRANAAFICKAANSHQKLVEALKLAYGIIVTINNGMEPRHSDMLTAIEESRAVLNLAAMEEAP